MALTNYVKFVRGSQEFYNALERKDQNTLYFVYDDINSSSGKLYLGNKLISISNENEKFSFSKLKDVLIKEPSKDGQFIAYDEAEQKWVNQEIEDALKLKIMTGATRTTNGLSGLVPAPKAGEQNKFLQGSGTWVTIDTQLPVINSVAISNLQNIVGTFTPVPSKYLDVGSAISHFNDSIENLDNRTKWHTFDE